MPWDFAKSMQVSPAMAVAKELQAGEIPAWVSVSVGGSAGNVEETGVVTAVVDVFGTVPVLEGMESLLDPAPIQ